MVTKVSNIPGDNLIHILILNYSFIIESLPGIEPGTEVTALTSRKFLFSGFSLHNSRYYAKKLHLQWLGQQIPT